MAAEARQLVRVTEVGPRDGLQNEPERVPTEAKARLIRALLAARPDAIEATSFVSPRWIPQLGDASDLLAMLAGGMPEDVSVSALVPNEKGLDRLLEANAIAAAGSGGRPVIDTVALFTAASETFSQKNTNASIAESIDRMRPVARRAHDAGLRIRGYISCAFACPFEGVIDVDAVLGVAQRLADDLAVDELSVADTIGHATPDDVARRVERVLAATPANLHAGLNLHLHDTFGRAADCVIAALGAGVRSFDASIAGLGGCPYASTPESRAPGNIATETLVAAIEHVGYATRIDRAALSVAHAVADRMLAEARAGATP
ncbi:MAG: hydroxymethylglutaryl-CoA lyase [Planctomycetota bacterium]